MPGALQQPQAGPEPASRRARWLSAAAAILALVIVAGYLLMFVKQPSSRLPTSTAPAAVASRNDSPYARLPGRWLRPDGGYLLVIDRVDPDGSAVAAYLNPQPIHVARARASKEGDLIRFFLELQDVNYPGSTYTLTYDPASDELRGEYFQAALKETFGVTFERTK